MDIENTKEMRIQHVLGSLDLVALTWSDRPIPDDAELALSQLMSRQVRMHGAVFATFVEAWVAEFGTSVQLTEERIKQHIESIMDEKVISVTRFLMRKHLKNEGPQSLAKAAAQVYDDRLPSFSQTKSEFMQRIYKPVNSLGTWNVQVIYREDGNISRYELSPGEVTIEFHKRVVLPYLTPAVQGTAKVLTQHETNVQGDI